MFDKLSFKIGMLFFVFILIIESILFFVLYVNLSNNRVDEVMESLLGRGNTHRDVLEDHFDQTTLKHVATMESASEFSVIITDKKGKVINSSNSIDKTMMDIATHFHNNDDIPAQGKVIKDDWERSKYIATDSPITIKGEHRGHVFMFIDSNYVKRTIGQLNNQFIIAAIMTVTITIITIFILSRFIAHPLIKMKKATEQISKGNHDVALNIRRNDELGGLAHSITKLATDLKELQRERNEFLASVSHELRTPLTYLKGYAEIINRKDITEEERSEYIKIIQEEAEELTGLVEHLFNLAKMDKNKFLIHPETVNLCSFLNQIVERIQPVLTEKGITCDVDCPGELEVFIDPERFQQVFINLLRNAKSHSKSGTIIKLNVSETKQNIVVKVIDQGEGIPEKDLPHIFDRLDRKIVV